MDLLRSIFGNAMHRIGKLSVLVFGALAFAPAFAQPPTPFVEETVKSGEVFATLRIDKRFSFGDLMIGFNFKSNTSTYPVGCLSVYRDVQYNLRDRHGRNIPVNPVIFTNPPYSGPKIVSVRQTFNPSATPARCEDERHEAYGQTNLSTLYPKLKAGTYVLNMTFAPRGIAQRTSFPPVPVTVTKALLGPALQHTREREKTLNSALSIIGVAVLLGAAVLGLTLFASLRSHQR